jgi:hypothetical protein
VRKLVSMFVAVAFLAGTAALAIAQTSTAPAAPAPADKKMDEKKADTGEKKMAAKSASGKVKSASADSLVVAGKSKGKDAEWTFALDSKTKIKKGGKDATATDLKEGDAVSVRYMEHDGKNVAQAVMARGEAKKMEGKPADKAEKPAEKK